MLFCFKIPYVRKVLDDPIVHGENPTFGIVKPPKPDGFGGYSGCGGRTRTYDLRVMRASFYINSRFIAFKNMQFFLNIIAFSQHFKALPFAILRRLCSKIVPKFFHCSWCRHASPPRLRLWRVAGVLCYFLFCFRLPGVAPRLSACALSRPRQISNSMLVACIMSRTFQ